MSSGCSFRVVLLVIIVVAAGAEVPAAAVRPRLRVCADPNNLPFTNARGEGFENAIAKLLADDLGREVSYYWQPQRRAFLRTTLDARMCDVVMSIPSRLERVRATRPYYRSSYVFVSRGDRRLAIRSFDDPQLRRLTIGVQVTGDDYANPPAAQALASRHLFDRVRGYPVYGNYSDPSPQRAIVDAVAAGTIDVAVVWGPLAGYYRSREPVPLTITPVAAQPGVDGPFAFDISLGVRKEDAALQQLLDAALSRRSTEVRRVLQRFGVPLTDAEER